MKIFQPSILILLVLFTQKCSGHVIKNGKCIVIQIAIKCIITKIHIIRL